jgi:hypothetical protein
MLSPFVSTLDVVVSAEGTILVVDDVVVVDVASGGLTQCDVGYREMQLYGSMISNVKSKLLQYLTSSGSTISYNSLRSWTKSVFPKAVKSERLRDTVIQ